MPINEYMSPNINRHQNTFVETYQPIDFQFLGGQLAKKQAEYDAGEQLTHAITDNIKINPLIQPHAEEAQQIKNAYRSEIDRTLEEAGGNYALAIPKLQDIGRRLQDDIQYGNIAKINNTTAEYNTKKKAIEDWGIKHNKNVDQQLQHLNYQTFGVYGQDPNRYKTSLRAYDYGAPVDTNEVIKQGISFLKDSGNTTIDISDPNWISKVRTEYSNPRLKSSLRNYLKSQAGIAYNVMLEDPTITDPSQVTDEQLNAYIDKMIKGPADAATFTKVTKDLDESALGKARAGRKAELEGTEGVGVTQTIISPSVTGETSDAVRTNYSNIGPSHRETLLRAATTNGINMNNVITYTDGTGTTKQLKLSDALNPANAAELKTALQSGDFNFQTVDGKRYDSSVLNNFKNSILPTLNKNEAVQQRFDESIKRTVDELYKPGMMLVKSGPETLSRLNSGNLKDSDLTLINKSDYEKLAKSKATGIREGNTYINEKGWPVVNGVVHYGTQFVDSKDRSKKGDIFNENLIYQADNSLSKILDKNIDATANNKVNHIFTKDPTGGIVTDNLNTTESYNKISNTMVNYYPDMTYFDPTDPYQQTPIVGGQNAALAAANQEDGFQGVSATPVPPKEGGVIFSGTPHNGKQIAKQFFDVKDAEGNIKRVSVLADVDNIVASGLVVTQNDPSFLVNKGLNNLRGRGNTVPLYYNNTPVDATLHNDTGQVTYRNESGELVTTTLAEWLKKPGAIDVISNYSK